MALALHPTIYYSRPRLECSPPHVSNLPLCCPLATTVCSPYYIAAMASTPAPSTICPLHWLHRSNGQHTLTHRHL
jgi:hypothetical protein